MKIKKRVPRKKDDVSKTEDLQVMLQDIQSRSSGVFDKYKLPVIAAVIAIVVIFVGVMSYTFLSSSWEKKASAMEYKAYNHFLEGDYAQSLASFQEIAEKYSSSRSAPVASYYIGINYSAMRQYDDAIKSYNSFIDKYSDQETLLPLAYINLGSIYMEKGDYNNAIAVFQNVLSMKDSLAADRAAYELAMAYEATGDTASAIGHYEGLTKKHPNSSWGQEAKVRLTKLKGDVQVPAANGQIKE